MKNKRTNNILLIFSNLSRVLVDDISELDEEIEDQRDAKEAIEFILSGVSAISSENKKTIGGMECDKKYKTIYDRNGYRLLNVLQDVYGIASTPFCVDVLATVKCDV